MMRETSMRQTYFSQKTPSVKESRTKAWLCRPLASVPVVGARQTWERDERCSQASYSPSSSNVPRRTQPDLCILAFTSVEIVCIHDEGCSARKYEYQE